MMEQYWIRVRGQVKGPFEEEQLQALVRRGQLSRIHEISADGDSWLRAEEYPQLFLSAVPVRRTLASKAKMESLIFGREASKCWDSVLRW